MIQNIKSGDLQRFSLDASQSLTNTLKEQTMALGYIVSQQSAIIGLLNEKHELYITRSKLFIQNLTHII